MNVTIVTTAEDDNSARALLRQFGMPFRQNSVSEGLKRKYGNDCKESEGREEAEVQEPAAQPLPAVRTAAGVPAQVWGLPAVLPRAGAEGRDPWGGEVQLVGRTRSSDTRLRAQTTSSTEGREAEGQETFPLVLCWLGRTG
jgi:hypothetical protein